MKTFCTFKNNLCLRLKKEKNNQLCLDKQKWSYKLSENMIIDKNKTE